MIDKKLADELTATPGLEDVGRYDCHCAECREFREYREHVARAGDREHPRRRPTTTPTGGPRKRARPFA